MAQIGVGADGQRQRRRTERKNFGAEVGQPQQLVQTTGRHRGAAAAKSLSGLARQSNYFGALRRVRRAPD